METLHALVYVSAAVKSFSDEALEAMLLQARRKNAGLGITGVLLHSDGNFMQYLEGPEAVLRRLFATIARDSRHQHVTVIVDEPIVRREFDGWAMAYRRLDRLEWLELAPHEGTEGSREGGAEGGGSLIRELLINFWNSCSR